MYLGHNYQEQCTTLSSRLTLELQKEVTLSFCNVVEITTESGKQVQVQGLALRNDVSKEELSVMIEDLDYLHINEIYTHELCMLIAPSKEAVQAYYDRYFKAEVADRVCRKFNFFRDGEGKNEEQIARYEEQMREELAHLHHTV